MDTKSWQKSFEIERRLFVYEITHFWDAIVNIKEIAPFGATIEDGYKDIVTSDAILKSADTGRRIYIKY